MSTPSCPTKPNQTSMLMQIRNFQLCEKQVVFRMAPTFPYGTLVSGAHMTLPPLSPTGSFFDTPGVVVMPAGAAPAVPAAAPPPTTPARGGSTLVVILQSLFEVIPSSTIRGQLRSLSVSQAAVMKATFMTRAEVEEVRARDTALHGHTKEKRRPPRAE